MLLCQSFKVPPTLVSLNAASVCIPSDICTSVTLVNFGVVNSAFSVSLPLPSASCYAHFPHTCLLSHGCSAYKTVFTCLTCEIFIKKNFLLHPTGPHSGIREASTHQIFNPLPPFLRRLSCSAHLMDRTPGATVTEINPAENFRACCKKNVFIGSVYI